MKGVITAALLLGAAAYIPAAAEDRQPPFPTYRGGGYFEDNTYSRKPARGYSGWAGPPIQGYYCDYRRYPIRSCKGGRCRTTGWRLQQYCY